MDGSGIVLFYAINKDGWREMYIISTMCEKEIFHEKEVELM